VKPYLKIFVFILTLSNLYTQESQKTLAVLDFEGRGINALEAATLTDRFTSEIGKTEKMILVDRSMVEEILNEQGFQQSGCTTDECAVEVGALLGVQFMINGSIGKLGETFTIDVKMTSVESGATEETRNVTYIGKVDGLVTEIELLAWDIMNLEAPKALREKKRLGAQAFLEASAKQKTRMGSLMRSTFIPGMGQFYSGRKLMGYVFLGTELAAGVLAYMSFSQYQTAQDDYVKYQTQYVAAKDPDQIAELKGLAQKALDDESAANDQITLMIYAVGAIHVTNMVHAFIRGPKVNTASKRSGMNLVYNHTLQQPQLRFSIALD
jgi:TolB-like protein